MLQLIRKKNLVLFKNKKIINIFKLKKNQGDKVVFFPIKNNLAMNQVKEKKKDQRQMKLKMLLMKFGILMMKMDQEILINKKQKSLFWILLDDLEFLWIF